MKMILINILLLLPLLFTCSQPSVDALQQTTEVEMMLNSSGEVAVIRTMAQRQLTWATLLIRGTHRDRPNDGFLDNVPFVDSLYTKYYTRRLRVSGVDTLINTTPQGMNFREHQASEDSIIRAFDFKKIPITSINVAQARADIIATAIFDSLKGDEIENEVEWKRWPWGTKERQDFFPLLFESFPVAKLDSIRNDSVKWKIDVLFFRDSLIVCGESLRNLTLLELNQCVDPPQKVKTWFQNNVLGKAGITVNTTIWELIKDHRGKAKNLWLRHPIFRKYVTRWIKRQN